MTDWTTQDVSQRETQHSQNPFDKSVIKAKTGLKTWLQLFLLSLGFFGIQFAWTIQMTRTSPLLERLGSDPLITALIWWAGPITGVLVQPIIGSWSDKTRSKWGRRRPFLLAGIILTTLWLCLMPNSPNLIFAASMLWFLDASINLTQGPYRALVPDVVADKSQQTTTYALMAFFIGLGSVASSLVGSFITSEPLLFYMGALMLWLCMGITMLSTPEIPIHDSPFTNTSNAQPSSSKSSFFLVDTLQRIVAMPPNMKRLCLAHSLTWFGLMCMFIFFSLFVAHNLFDADNPANPNYMEAVRYGSLCYTVFNVVSALFSPAIGPLTKRYSNKVIHTLGLLCLAGGLISMGFITEPIQAMWSMGFVGIGWATTLSVPFAMLAKHIPTGQEGVMMGTFNIFIAAPQIFASALAGCLVAYTHNDSHALLLGGFAVLLSVCCLQWVQSE